jgi:hypothetical protein
VLLVDQVTLVLNVVNWNTAEKQVVVCYHLHKSIKEGFKNAWMLQPRYVDNTMDWSSDVSTSNLQTHARPRFACVEKMLNSIFVIVVFFTKFLYEPGFV